MVETSWALIFEAVRTGEAIIDEEKRNRVLKWFTLLMRKNRKIVVFGISGAGKTQFINSLFSNIKIPERTLITDNFYYELKDFPIVFIDTPGHSARDFERQKELIEILKNGVEGIINVVSYGYEENPEVSLKTVLTIDGTIRDGFLKDNRQAEIKRLTEWLPQIHPSNIGWIINLVNKADLWWDKQEEVYEHYNSGDYFEVFRNIDKFTHVLSIPYCSLIQLYFNIATSGRFGEIHKAQMRNHFMHQLLNLVKEKE